MNQIRALVISVAVLFVSSCSTNSFIPVDGAMDGRSGIFCDDISYRIEVNKGFVCKRINKIILQIDTSHLQQRTELENMIAEKFKKEIITKLKDTYDAADIEFRYFGPIKDIERNIRLYSPAIDTLKIEIHMLNDEEKNDQACRNYWLLMITSDMYLRSAEEYCADSEQLNNESYSSFIVNTIYGILENDIFKY